MTKKLVIAWLLSRQIKRRRRRWKIRPSVMVQRTLDSVHAVRDKQYDQRDRMARMETQLAGVCRDLARLTEVDAYLAHRMDGFSDRLERIERRVERVDSPAG